MPALYENLSKTQADVCGLVLSSSGIPFRLVKDKNGYTVRVGEDMYHRALSCMERYFSENKEMPLLPRRSVRVSSGSVISGMIAAFILLVCHGLIIRLHIEDTVMNTFGSSAHKIMHGELYRTVTSLMLHSDMRHLAGNMIGVVVFGTAVCSISGSGVAWLMILISGAVGNLINAYMFESGHISIGASTAIFGAIGILSGYQMIDIRRLGRKRFAAWIPMACGLALLGLLGSEPYSDITAHFFGFVTGIVMGLIYSLCIDSPPTIVYQIFSALMGCVLIGMAWLEGWRTMA